MQLDTYFVSTATENFTLTFTGDTTALQGAKPPPLKVNGLETHRRHGRRSVWLAGNLIYFSVRCLLVDIEVYVYMKGVLSESTKIQYAEGICRAATICQTMELDKEELEYINSPALTAAKQPRIDLNLPTV